MVRVDPREWRRDPPPRILAPMLPPRRVLRFAVALLAIVAPFAAVVGASVGCGPDVTMVWVCLNPKTGREDPSIGDPTHYVGGVLDPCHCYDPCGESNECPILV